MVFKYKTLLEPGGYEIYNMHSERTDDGGIGFFSKKLYLEMSEEVLFSHVTKSIKKLHEDRKTEEKIRNLYLHFLEFLDDIDKISSLEVKPIVPPLTDVSEDELFIEEDYYINTTERANKIFTNFIEWADNNRKDLKNIFTEEQTSFVRFMFDAGEFEIYVQKEG